MWFEYQCECGAWVRVKGRIGHPPNPTHCIPMRRLFDILHVWVYDSATDHIDKVLRMEADPLPGLTREQTRQVALSMARR